MRSEHVVLPMSRALFRHLDELNRGFNGHELVTIMLTGFLQIMMVRNFDLKKHVSEIDELDGITGFESIDYKLDMTVSITRMTISYRNYFSGRKFGSIGIHMCRYNKRSLKFTYEVKDERK